jgi:hypothetical protein
VYLCSSTVHTDSNNWSTKSVTEQKDISKGYIKFYFQLNRPTHERQTQGTRWRFKNSEIEIKLVERDAAINNYFLCMQIQVVHYNIWQHLSWELPVVQNICKPTDLSYQRLQLLVTVTTRSEFLIFFVGSNSSRGMNVYLCVCLRLVRMLALKYADPPTKFLKRWIISRS